MKRILLVAFISIMALGASAQLASPISLGVHGGWSSTKINTKGTSFSNVTSSASGGYMFGIFGRLNLGKLYIQPELNYCKKTGSIEIPIPVANAATVSIVKMASDLTYSSIDIPILLGYKIVKLPFVNVHVFAGPVASFSTSALKIKPNIPAALNGTISEDTINADFDPNTAMWNLKMGAGVEVWKLNLDFDYEMGLREFNANMKAPQIFNITLGLRLI